MWVNQVSPQADFMRFDRKKSMSVQKRFQWKYTSFLMGAVFIGLMASLIPMLYFFNQNYDIFSKIAFQTSPELLSHLDRERSWLNGYVISVILATLTFCLVFGLRATGRMIGPILVVQNHLRSLTRGQWSIREVNIRDNDEFRDFVSGYNYFYHCLRQMTEEDIHKLEQLVVDKNNRTSMNLWRRMVREKSRQIEYSASAVNDADSSLSHDSRHVS